MARSMTLPDNGEEMPLSLSLPLSLVNSLPCSLTNLFCNSTLAVHMIVQIEVCWGDCRWLMHLPNCCLSVVLSLNNQTIVRLSESWRCCWHLLHTHLFIVLSRSNWTVDCNNMLTWVQTKCISFLADLQSVVTIALIFNVIQITYYWNVVVLYRCHLSLGVWIQTLVVGLFVFCSMNCLCT